MHSFPHRNGDNLLKHTSSQKNQGYPRLFIFFELMKGIVGIKCFDATAKKIELDLMHLNIVLLFVDSTFDSHNLKNGLFHSNTGAGFFTADKITVSNLEKGFLKNLADTLMQRCL